MEGGLRKALGYTASGNRHCYWQVRAGCRSLAHRREPISQDLAARSRLPRCGSRSRVKAGLHSLATHQELDGVEKALSLRRDTALQTICRVFSWALLWPRAYLSWAPLHRYTTRSRCPAPRCRESQIAPLQD